MALKVLDKVVASRDIRRYRTVVAKSGTPGVIVAAQSTSCAVSYTVEFQLRGVTCGRVSVPQVDTGDIHTPVAPAAMRVADQCNSVSHMDATF